MWRHDTQVQLLASDLGKAAGHPITEPRPESIIHRQRPDIKALGTYAGTDVYDVTVSHPLSAGRLAASSDPNPLGVLRTACFTKVTVFRYFYEMPGLVTACFLYLCLL